MNEESNNTEEIIKKILSDYHKQNQIIVDSIARQADENFSKLDARLTSIEDKLKSLSSDTTQNFEKVDHHLTSIQGELAKIGQATPYEDMAINLKMVAGGKNK